jgi:hypothetical protein
MTKRELLRRFRDLEHKHSLSIRQLFTIANSVNGVVHELREAPTKKDQQQLKTYQAWLNVGGLDLATLLEIYNHCTESLELGAEANSDLAVREFCADALARDREDAARLQELIERMVEKERGNGHSQQIIHVNGRG